MQDLNKSKTLYPSLGLDEGFANIHVLSKMSPTVYQRWINTVVLSFFRGKMKITIHRKKKSLMWIRVSGGKADHGHRSFSRVLQLLLACFVHSISKPSFSLRIVPRLILG